MPWKLQDLGSGSSGLIRTAHFTNSNHNLNNLNGTLLLAKLNGVHLGIFVSGEMKVEYKSINGYNDPHAEDNMSQALRDTFAELKTAGHLRDAGNVLSIKLSKSPCSRCTTTLTTFLATDCAPRNIKIRIKIMKLYEGEPEATVVRSIGTLVKAGIICIPWRIEDKYDDEELVRTETKLRNPHELKNQGMTADDIRLLEKRTTDLESVAPLSSVADYKGVKVARTRESIEQEVTSLKNRITACETRITEEDMKQNKLTDRRRKAEGELKKIKEDLAGRRPTPGSAVANTIFRIENTTLPGIEKESGDVASKIVAIKTQRDFLETRLKELETLLG
jgi:hypothetical protein